MKGYKFLRLISNKVILRSYSYLLHFLHLIFGGKWFPQLCPKLPRFVQKPQGILGVKMQFSFKLRSLDSYCCCHIIGLLKNNYSFEKNKLVYHMSHRYSL
jgi:hypothetical protein